jgi:hypothetical protein
MPTFNLMNDPNHETTIVRAFDYIDRRNLSNQIVVDVDGIEMNFAGKIPVNNGKATALRNNQIAQFTRNQKITDRLRAKLNAKNAV